MEMDRARDLRLDEGVALLKLERGGLLTAEGKGGLSLFPLLLSLLLLLLSARGETEAPRLRVREGRGGHGCAGGFSSCCC